MGLLEFRSCQSMQKLWHQQKTTQGFENFLHVTNSITYRSTDLLIIQHHFRLLATGFKTMNSLSTKVVRES